MDRMAAMAHLFSMLAVEETAALARGLRKRDPELLDALIERYQYRLFRYLLYLTGNRETAEDLFQETWFRVLERGRQYDGRSRFETWLFSIARHLVIDLQRRRKPHSLDALTGPDDEGYAVPDGGPSPLELASARQEGVALERSLGRLAAVSREVLLLRFQEDLTIEEIASVAGVPVSTVKSRLYRGLRELRGMLEGEAS